jgi:hypothetical protein
MHFALVNPSPTSEEEESIILKRESLQDTKEGHVSVYSICVDASTSQERSHTCTYRHIQAFVRRTMHT